MKIPNTSQTIGQYRTEEKLHQSPNVQIQPPPDVAKGFAQLTGKMGELFGKYATEKLKNKNRAIIETHKQAGENEIELFKQKFLTEVETNQQTWFTSHEIGGVTGELINPDDYVRAFDKRLDQLLKQQKNKMHPQAWLEHSGKLRLQGTSARNKVIEFANKETRKINLLTSNKSIEIGLDTFEEVMTEDLLKAKTANLLEGLERNKVFYSQDGYRKKRIEIEDAFIYNQLRLAVGSTSPTDQKEFLLNGGKFEDINGNIISEGDRRWTGILTKIIDAEALYLKGLKNHKAATKVKINQDIYETLNPFIGEVDINKVIKAQQKLKDSIRGNITLDANDKNALYKQVDNFFKNTSDNEKIKRYWELLAGMGGIKGSLLNNFHEHASVYFTPETRNAILATNTANKKEYDKKETAFVRTAMKRVYRAFGEDALLAKLATNNTEVDSDTALLIVGNDIKQETLFALKMLHETLESSKDKGISVYRALTEKHDFKGDNTRMSLIDYIIEQAPVFQDNDWRMSPAELEDTLNKLLKKADGEYVNKAKLKDTPYLVVDDGGGNIRYLQRVETDVVTEQAGQEVETVRYHYEPVEVELANHFIVKGSDIYYLNQRQPGESTEQHLDRIQMYTAVNRYIKKHGKESITSEKIQEIADILGFDAISEIKVKESIRAQDWLQAVYNKYPQMQEEFDEMTDKQIKEWVDLRETGKQP